MSSVRIYNPIDQEFLIAPSSAYVAEGISTFGVISLEAWKRCLEDSYQKPSVANKNHSNLER